MCTVLLPPVDNPIVVNKYIIFSLLHSTTLSFAKMATSISCNCAFQNEIIISDIIKLFGVFGPKVNLLRYKIIILMYSFRKQIKFNWFSSWSRDSLCIERDDYWRVVICKIKYMISESAYNKFDSHNQHALYIVRRHYTSRKKAVVLKHRKDYTRVTNFWPHHKEKLQTKRRYFPH